jgi:hypothetical protein
MSHALFTDLPTSIVVNNGGADDVILTRVGRIAAGASKTISLSSKLESKRLLIWKSIKSARDAGVLTIVSGATGNTGRLRVSNASGSTIVIGAYTLLNNTETDILLDAGSAGERNRLYRSIERCVAGGLLTIVNADTETPTITSLSVVHGPATGGTVLTILGTGFSPDSIVSFGTDVVAATFVDDNHLTVTSPAGIGAKNVKVDNGGGHSVTSSNAWYNDPTFTSLSISKGHAAGGDAATITGHGFINGTTSATLGGTSLSITVVSATSITFTTPAHATGLVDLVITNGAPHSVTGTGVFTYGPTFVSITPNTGAAAGGDAVDIAGTGFVSGVTTITIGGLALASPVFVSSSHITGVTPAHGAGAVSVVVGAQDSAISATAAGAFTYS